MKRPIIIWYRTNCEVRKVNKQLLPTGIGAKLRKFSCLGNTGSKTQIKSRGKPISELTSAAKCGCKGSVVSLLTRDSQRLDEVIRSDREFLMCSGSRSQLIVQDEKRAVRHTYHKF